MSLVWTDSQNGQTHEEASSEGTGQREGQKGQVLGKTKQGGRCEGEACGAGKV